MVGDPPRHLLWVFPGFGIGGAQVRFAALANAFGSRCRHTVVSLNGETACVGKLAPGVDVRLQASGHRRGRMVRAILHARTILRAARPDLVITSNWGAIEWALGARLARLPHVHTEDGFGPEERQVQIGRRVLVRRFALGGSEVVVPSRTLQRIALGQWGLAPGHVHLIPNGIDLARFAAAAPMPAPAGAGKVVGTVAALRPEKNIGRLLRAFAALRAVRPARLVVVGDGPERAGLERLATTLGVGDSVHFTGITAQTERWLAGFDAFALSSDTEQMPLSLLEAMAAGLPAVCTDVGDVRAMLPAESAAFVTPVGDAAFADGLARLMNADGAALGEANRAKAAASYGQDAMFEAWAKLLGITPVTAG